jgi:uncharacterized protein
MYRHLMVALAVAGVFAAGAPGRAADGDKIRVLIIDGQNNHNWRATTPFMQKVLEDSGRFSVDVATTPQEPALPAKPRTADDADLSQFKQKLIQYADAYADFRRAFASFQPDLEKYDVLLSNYNGEPWPAKFEQALQNRLQAGKIGLVIVHAANNSFTEWGEYNRMIGMGWRDNKFGDRLTLTDDGKELRVPKGAGPGAGHGAQHPFAVTVRDTEHPITRGMPREWLHTQDELYHGMRGPLENVHLLATAFSDKAKGGTGEHEPMIWTVEYGKGRVFHTPLGHDLPGMRCVGFVTTLQRGSEWAATGKVTIPIPDNFPTAEKPSSLPEK